MELGTCFVSDLGNNFINHNSGNIISLNNDLVSDKLSRFKKGYSPSTDKIQKKIIKEVRKLGWSVETDHDDIIIGRHYKKINYSFWLELKSAYPFRQDGYLKPKTIRPEQFRILSTYKGDYCIAWTLEQVLWWCYPFKNLTTDLDRSKVITPAVFQRHYKRIVDPKELKLLRAEEWWCLD